MRLESVGLAQRRVQCNIIFVGRCTLVLPHLITIDRVIVDLSTGTTNAYWVLVTLAIRREKMVVGHYAYLRPLEYIMDQRER